jgi:hypothetical protein
VSMLCTGTAAASHHSLLLTSSTQVQVLVQVLVLVLVLVQALVQV